MCYSPPQPIAPHRPPMFASPTYYPLLSPPPLPILRSPPRDAPPQQPRLPPAQAVTIAALTSSPPRRPRAAPPPAGGDAAPTPPTPSRADVNDVRADRYHRSRAFGQTHRANALAQENRRAVELDDLRREHALLRSLLSRAEDVHIGAAPPPVWTPHTRTHALGARAAAVLGTRELDGTTALALLELTALRRNLTGGVASRERAPPPSPALDNVFRTAAARYSAENSAPAHAAARLATLDALRERWDGAEALRDAIDEAVEDEEDARARRGLGPRRCTRCKKVKLAGSGHGRSSCDDGVSVALDIPYPAPPALARSLAATPEDAQ